VPFSMLLEAGNGSSAIPNKKGCCASAGAGLPECGGGSDPREKPHYYKSLVE
jgi:hypothetical protein